MVLLNCLIHTFLLHNKKINYQCFISELKSVLKALIWTQFWAQKHSKLCRTNCDICWIKKDQCLKCAAPICWLKYTKDHWAEKTVVLKSPVFPVLLKKTVKIVFLEVSSLNGLPLFLITIYDLYFSYYINDHQPFYLGNNIG